MSEIVQEVYEYLSKKTDEINKLLSTSEAIEDKIRSGRYSDAVVRQELTPQRDEIRLEIRQKSEQAIRDAREKVAEYRRTSELKNRLNPKELTDDIKLLRAGITLNAEDLRGMLDRNSENRTMTQIILRYAKEHNTDLGVYFTGGDEEKTTADELDNVLSYYADWIGKPDAGDVLDKFFGVKAMGAF